MVAGLSSPVRVKLIHFLSQGPLTVEVLADKIGQSVANTSMHLRKMLACQIVSVSAQAQKRIYSLHPAVFEFWEVCQNVSQKIDPSLAIDSTKVYADLDWKEDLHSIIKAVKIEKTVILDVRPRDEITQSLKGLNVLNIPSTDLINNLNRLPKDKTILVFCRGRLCALSSYAVQLLRENGFNAFRLNHSWYALNNLDFLKGGSV